MKETLGDFLSPLKEVISTRLASPLTSTYVISWSLWNYKLILIIFSNNEVTTTFKLIDKHVFPSIPCTLINLFAPFVVAIFYLYGYQRISNWVHRDQIERQSKHQNHLKEAAKTKLLTVEESQLLEAEMISIRAKYNTEISTYIKKQNDLEKIIKTLHDKIAEPRTNSENKVSEKIVLLDEEDKLILTMMGEEMRSERQALKNRTNLDTLAFEFHFRRLIENKYIEEFEHEHADTISIYVLTQKARSYLLSRKKTESENKS